VGQVHCPFEAPVQLPSHAADDPAHPPCPTCGAPVTGVQIPGVVVSQAWHGPAQAWLQQTLSGEQVVPAMQPALAVVQL